MKLGILISGRGSNMQALVDSCADPDFPAEVALVISNRNDAGGLETARAAGVATKVIDHKAYDDRDSFEQDLHSALQDAGVDLVCLAGFMRLLNPDFVGRWRDRMINIHPSLLPAYKGLNTHERALEDGVKFIGCTVHFVRAEMDTGPIIAQAVLPVLPDDSPDSLADRVLLQEHVIYRAAVRAIAEKRVRVTDQRVVIDNITAEDTVLISAT